MRKSARNRIIAWSIVSVLLIAVLVWSIIAVKQSISSMNLWNLSFSDSDLEMLTNKDDLVSGNADFNADEIKSLNIDWAAGEVEFVLANTDKITISEDTTSNNSDMNMCWYVNNEGELSVYATKKTLSFINIFNSVENKNLTVTIPREHHFDDIDISTASADVNASKLIANDVSIDTASGNVEISIFDAQDVDITNVSGYIDIHTSNVKEVTTDSVSGKSEVSGSYKELNASSISGEIKPVVESEASCVTADTVSGKVHFMVADTISGFMIEHDSVSGRVETDFMGKDMGDSFVYGDGMAEFTVDTVSGNIVIEKYSVSE